MTHPNYCEYQACQRFQSLIQNYPGLLQHTSLSAYNSRFRIYFRFFYFCCNQPCFFKYFSSRLRSIQKITESGNGIMTNKVNQWIHKKTRQNALVYSDEELKIRIQLLGHLSNHLTPIVSNTLFLNFATLFITLSTYTSNVIAQNPNSGSALLNQQSALLEGVMIILSISSLFFCGRKYYVHTALETLLELLRQRTR